MSPYQLRSCRVAVGLAVTAVAAAVTAAPYNPTLPYGKLLPGEGRVFSSISGASTAILPQDVWGKEFSHDADRDRLGVRDQEQITLWDGKANTGAVADGRDYTGNPWTSTDPARRDRDEVQIDALANTRDALFDDLLRDRTAMVFSYNRRMYDHVAQGFVVLPSGPQTVYYQSNPVTVGGPGELTRTQHGKTPPTLSPWANRSTLDRGNLPTHVDGLELWGDRPDPSLPDPGDANKYSLTDDAVSDWSLFNEGGSGYLRYADVVNAVTGLLGAVPGDASGTIDLDAAVVLDGYGSPDVFEVCRNPDRGCDVGVRTDRQYDQEGKPIGEAFGFYGPGGGFQPSGQFTAANTVVFSIGQIASPSSPNGLYATGSELFVLNRFGTTFLEHDGAVWDKDFALQNLGLNFAGAGADVFGVLDINALEILGDLEVPPNDVRLVGDYNDDGTVDAGDFTIWRDHLGQTGPNLPGDGTFDGIVDDRDYDLWAANYGATLGPLPATAVPEPTAAALVCGLAILPLAAADVGEPLSPTGRPRRRLVGLPKNPSPVVEPCQPSRNCCNGSWAA